jgi:hypothetical protein
VLKPGIVYLDTDPITQGSQHIIHNAFNFLWDILRYSGFLGKPFILGGRFAEQCYN